MITVTANPRGRLMTGKAAANKGRKKAGQKKSAQIGSASELSIEQIALEMAKDHGHGIEQEARSKTGDSTELCNIAGANTTEDLDWSLNGLLNHPEGVEQALAKNLAAMEQRTRELIEKGSTEELIKALEENHLQLLMLQERIANIAKMSSHA